MDVKTLPILIFLNMHELQIVRYFYSTKNDCANEFELVER